MERFGVSRPTLREAFRVLESESLISVRRGAHGGARVHLPNADVPIYDPDTFYSFHPGGANFLFGDGSVVVLDTPGHTMGHQSLKLRLKQTGTVIITGDAIWMQENLDGYVPGINYNTAETMRSIEKLKRIRDLESGQIFMSHDEASYKKGTHDSPYR